MPSKRPAQGGVELRVFGGGQKGSHVGRSDSAPPEEEVEAELAEESVVRLDKREVPLANRRVEDEEVVEAVPLARSKRKLGLRAWTLIMSGIAVILAVASVWGAMAFNRIRPGEDIQMNQMKVVDDPIPDDSDEQGLLIDANSLIQRSVDLFEEYRKAESVDEVIDMIRDGERLRPILDERWKPFGGVHDQLGGRLTDVDGRYFVIIAGTKDSGVPFEFVLVSEGEELKIDWKSTVAYGDIEVEELRELEVGRTVKMRVQMWPSNFFPLEYPEEKFRCFRIDGGDDESESIYGYVPLGTRVAGDVSEAWNEGTVLFRQENAVAAIIYLKNEGRGQFGQFVISEFVQKGWIEE